MQKIKVAPIKAIELVVQVNEHEVCSELHTSPESAALAWAGYILRKAHGGRRFEGRGAWQLRAYNRCRPVFNTMFDTTTNKG